MNISVRVLSANAQAQIKALQAQVRALQGQLASANATSAAPNAFGGARQRKSLMAFGNQIQWTGRQLQYNWTLPILLAGAAATKFALDNEKAFTRVKKVYGDTTAAAAQFNKEMGLASDAQAGVDKATATFANELKALDGAFEALSNRYGVNQKEVIETAGAWAAAGASGIALAKSTNISLKASILGEMELGKATESLIAIQAQYSLSTKQLNLTLSELNAIENQTGISMQGLIDGFARSAGVAREAGVDVRHLGAMMAALVPATGSAANAGNSLKTIISRLLSPTGEAAKVMAEFGVNTADAAWQSSTAVERLTILANKMDSSLKQTGKATKDAADDGYELSDAQKSVVASTLGSRYQMNRFLVLMREMAPAMSYYEKALDATSDRTKVFEQANRELDAVLASSPRRLAIIWTTLQNGMADAIAPMIPYMLYLAQSVAKAVTWFSNLDPAVQKLALVMLIALAAVGPLVRYFGSLLTLLGAMALPFKALIGWWVAFATITRTVDGETRQVRRSFLGMMASMIATPFKFVIAGLAGIVAALWGIVSGTAGAALAQRGLGAVFAAVHAGMAAVMARTMAVAAVLWLFMQANALAVIARLPIAWGLMLVQIAAIQAVGMASVLQSWVVGLALMSRATVGSSVGAAFGALLFSLRYAAVNALAAVAMVFVAFGARLPMIMGAMQARLMFVMETIQLALLAAWSFLAMGIRAIWTAMYVAMATVSTWGTALLVRVQNAALAIFVPMHAAFSATMVAIWAGMQRALAVVTTAGAVGLRIIWFNLHMAMLVISSATMTGLVTLWSKATKALLLFATKWLNIKTILMNLRFAIAAFSTSILPILTGPWGIAIAAIIGILYLFRDEIKQVWGNTVSYFADETNAMTQFVMRAWNSLPQGVSNALVAVARVVQNAALQIYEWFSYINPFARHSPSLVENVTLGMSVVGAQFGLASKAIGAHVRGAYSDINAFGKAVRGLLNGAATFEQAQERASIKKFAPGALDEYDRLAKRLKQLNGDLGRIQKSMDAQEAVVNRWTNALERANQRIDNQQKKLDRLTATQEKWQEKLSGAQDRLADFASAPIEGMGAMSDAIFENEMAQKRLRLEMMKMEDVGGTLDDVQAKIEALNGAQELLGGQKADLRAAGAGSEITGMYDAQIDALEKTKQQQNAAAESINKLSAEMAKLERQGERLDLENSLKFDPLTRQIEKAADAMKELPFDKIMAGVNKASADIVTYQQKLDNATAAVDRQQAVVDRLTEARDRAQERLDKEQDTLDAIKDRYDLVNDAIGRVEETMQSAAGAADKLAQKADEAAKKSKKAKEGAVSPAVQNFRDAAGGNFAKVGGAGIPMRADWSDQSDGIDAFVKKLTEDSTKAFGDLNPFAPLKEKWNQFKAWSAKKWGEFSTAGKDMLGSMFSGVGDMDTGWATRSMDKIRVAWAETKDWFSKWIIKPITMMWSLFWPSIKEIAVNAWNGLKEIWKQIGPVLGEVIGEIAKMGPAFKGLWNIILAVLAPLAAMFMLTAKVILAIVAKTIYPIFQAIGNVVENLVQVFKGALQIVSGFFMLFAPGHFMEGLKKMGAGVLNIFSGMFGSIGQLFRGAVKTIGMLFWGIVDGVIDAAMWLWDEMTEHSIIPDMINAIIFWFEKLADLGVWVWENVAKPIYNFFVKLWDLVSAALGLWFSAIKAVWGALFTVAVWLWDNVLKPVWDMFTKLWGVVKAALELWFSAIKAVWGALFTVAVWLWDNVLKPVWDMFTKLWDVVKGALDLWWEGVKVVWSALFAVAEWVWDNVLKPIWDVFVFLWEEAVKPALSLWWEGVKLAWKALLKVGTWVWDNVLKPVWEMFLKLWDVAKAALSLWWSGVVAVWEVLKTLGMWFWNNVLQPIFNKIKEIWSNHIKPEFDQWKGRIETAWNALKTLGVWVWDNVLKPIFNKIKDLWTESVKPELDLWKGRIEKAWDGLKKMGTWIKTEVMDPVMDAFSDGWTAVKNWMTNHADMLTKPARTIVEAVVDAVNFLIKGLNGIADLLPGFDWHIDPIKLEAGGKVPRTATNSGGGAMPLYAAGTAAMARRVAGGFKTNGARAIVGEGKANHPEYVIPTDPTYRNRAKGLLASAAAKLGMTTMSVSPRGIGGDSPKDAIRMMAAGRGNEIGLPQFAEGGILGAIKNGMGKIGKIGGDAWDYLKDHGKDAVSFMLEPFYNKAMNKLDKQNWHVPVAMTKNAAGSMMDWSRKADTAYASETKDEVAKGGPAVERALAFAYSQVGKPYGWGAVGPDAYDCSGFMSALTNVMRGQSPYSRVGATGSFPWGGFAPGAGPFTIGSSPNYAGSGVGHMAGTLGGVNVESAGGVGIRVGPSARGYNDSGFSQVYHLTNAANGAIARASKGGSIIRAGEAGHDEAVVPLPRGWKQSGILNPTSSTQGDTYVNMYGDLVFPNITDPNDAEALIENLKSLAGGGQ